MPAEFWTETARMVTSGLLVAAVAVPVGLIARAVRPKSEPLLPRWKPWRVPWTGWEIFFAFLLVQVLPSLLLPALDTSGFYQAVYGPDFPAIGTKDLSEDRLKEVGMLRALWANVFALPLQLGLLVVLVRALHPKWKSQVVGQGSLAGKLSLAVLAWLVLTPIVLVFNTVVNEIAKELGAPPESHPLTKLGGHPAVDQVLFVVEACIGAPIREEGLVRGLVLAWCIGRTKMLDGGKTLSGARPLFVMAVAAVFAVASGKAGAIAFAALLMGGLGLLWRFKHTGARRARAVYATAAFFALMHPTWPNPIPLFVLALGLGWLAVRTNGLLVPVLVHALFNAVSAIFVLRGGAG